MFVLVEQVGCNHPQPLHTIRGLVGWPAGCSFFLSLLSLSLFVRGVHVVQYVRTTASFFILTYFSPLSHTFLLSPSFRVWSSCGARNLYWFGFFFCLCLWTACLVLLFLWGRCWIACISCFFFFFFFITLLWLFLYGVCCVRVCVCVYIVYSIIQARFWFVGRGSWFVVGWWGRNVALRYGWL